MKKREFLFKLHLARGIGSHGEHLIYRFLEHYQKIKLPLKLNQIIRIAQIRGKFQNRFIQDYQSSALLQRMLRNDQEHWLSIYDPLYPKCLRNINDAPNILFYRGDISLLQQRCLGVVGARKYSQYGVNSIYKILPPLIKQQVVIIAGLAEGVDSIAHRCAMINHGRTIAVIGTGLDCYYPRFNQELQDKIALTQLLVTEYPLGSVPRRFHFPQRNRIIAGLIGTVLIVQARSHSGSLITAHLALNEGRNVFAIPGRIDEPLSAGCNDLIKHGAVPICSAKDLEEEFSDLTK